MAERPVLTDDKTRERLAEALFFVMDRLDPPQESVAWEALPEIEKDFYRAVIRAMESERGLWLRLFCGEAY